MARGGTGSNGSIDGHPVVSHEQWIAARTAFLADEKEFTRRRDELSQRRRDLPWERVDTPYVFDGPTGQLTLAQLFGDRSQLIVYHFMFNPAANDGCKHCSFWADNFNDVIVHLNHRDVTMVAVSRAPLAKLEAFKKRMGWSFLWVSSGDGDFNYDYQASFRPQEIQQGGIYNYVKTKVMADREGVSVFYKDAKGTVYHTYSTYARGIDLLNAAYNYIDLTPKGRDEPDPPGPQAWVRYHDRYEG
jgi:predicted dithiol-disulfide oxidoreductase (DUF899 family)